MSVIAASSLLIVATTIVLMIVAVVIGWVALWELENGCVMTELWLAFVVCTMLMGMLFLLSIT